jgi:hypothetical protein
LKSATALVSAILAIGWAAFLAPGVPRRDTRVSLVLVDHETRQPIPGVVRIRASKSLTPTNLTSRGWGLDQKTPIGEWLVLPGKRSIDLPAQPLVIDAISGIETGSSQTDLDLTNDARTEIEIPLRRFSRVREGGWACANTHLHLKDLTALEADQYLKEIPAADRLDALFVSYLERAEEDRTYISNRYPPGRLKHLESGGVVVSNGQEHRHNFGPQGEGFGHVMLLGIKELVQPVSIGAGISKKDPDWPSIGTGIDRAHAQGGTAIWCHNHWGFEDVPNWLAGRLDAQNIFDGGSHGSYEDSFYHYLSAGLRIPFSTGTDWFMYDFARCYAQVSGELTPESWLGALRSGRTFITNGPLLEFKVDGHGPGEALDIAAAREFKVIATARGRLDFGRLELVKNGHVVETAMTRPEDGHFEATLSLAVTASEPCWLAARITSDRKNEYGSVLFAHTSPVYITRQGRTVCQEPDVRFLMTQVEFARSEIMARGKFDTDSQRGAIIGLYDHAMVDLKDRLARRQSE